jgi:hypothetical protein
MVSSVLIDSYSRNRASGIIPIDMPGHQDDLISKGIIPSNDTIERIEVKIRLKINKILNSKK